MALGYEEKKTSVHNIKNMNFSFQMFNEISDAKPPLVCDSLRFSASPAVGEQRAAPGSQARAEGTEGQLDSWSPAGALLQRLAALLHYQHGSGKEWGSWVLSLDGISMSLSTLCRHLNTLRSFAVTQPCIDLVW